MFFLFLILELGNRVNTTFVLNIMQRIGFCFFFLFYIYEFLNVYLINSFPFWLSNIWDSLAILMLLFLFFSFLFCFVKLIYFCFFIYFAVPFNSFVFFLFLYFLDFSFYAVGAKCTVAL